MKAAVSEGVPQLTRSSGFAKAPKTRSTGAAQTRSNMRVVCFKSWLVITLSPDLCLWLANSNADELAEVPIHAIITRPISICESYRQRTTNKRGRPDRRCGLRTLLSLEAFP